MVALLYRTLQSTLICTIRWFGARRWLAAGSNFALKIAVKPLQIKTWLLLTVYKLAIALVIALSNGTTTELLRRRPLRFSHNYRRRQTAEGKTTDRQHIVPKTQPNGPPKRMPWRGDYCKKSYYTECAKKIFPTFWEIAFAALHI